MAPRLMLYANCTLIIIQKDGTKLMKPSTAKWSHYLDNPCNLNKSSTSKHIYLQDFLSLTLNTFAVKFHKRYERIPQATLVGITLDLTENSESIYSKARRKRFINFDTVLWDAEQRVRP